MPEPHAHGVSLWLMPEGEVRDRLSALLDGLAARLGTTPFPPHLTLLPGIAGSTEGDVLAASRTLARGLQPLAVRLVEVEGGAEHFRCLFARATADAPLVSAHAASARAFGRTPDPAFLPHLSLVYGALEPDAKRQLAAALRGAVELAFEARRLHVWRTEGPPGDWQELGSFAFPSD